MKAGVCYVLGFLVMFIYFYVYAVNYIRGIRADEIPDPVKTVQGFHNRVFLISYNFHFLEKL